MPNLLAETTTGQHALVLGPIVEPAVGGAPVGGSIVGGSYAGGSFEGGESVGGESAGGEPAGGEPVGSRAGGPSVLSRFRAVTPAIAQLPDAIDNFDALTDSELLDVQSELAQQKRLLEARSVLVAGQIARRSASELGSDGLAQRGGYRTAEELIRVTTGATASETRTAVRVGSLLDETHRGGQINQVTGQHFEPRHPWLAPVARAVASGQLSVDAAESIRNGLGDTTPTITAGRLSDAVAVLVGEAAVLDADRLYRRARQLRDELDSSGIAAREEERRAARSLRLHRRVDGTGRLVWELDPETLAIVAESYDQLTSPRRGGPRFVAPDDSPETRRREGLLTDSRTTDQLASDGFLELLRIASETAPTELIGLRRPSVRVLVAATTLATREGHGSIEGHADPVSIETVERFACADGVIPITIDSDGQPLNVGREQRLYTRQQRIALAARDGGCRWPGCERPPSWSEAHHIKHWHRDRGSTDIADGILLCRHHHLLAHNNGWEITRDRGNYSLIPPRSNDPQQTPIPMPSKSTAIAETLAAAHATARPQ